MKYPIVLLIMLFIFSCGKDKIIQLPEITHSKITEINDVSVAYLFYVETKPDSVELNRKNLISTTNWLVNVDKRLTLKQAIPYIKFLQDKKNTSSHKNENAKNYFTCNDTSRRNLGFIEFTNVAYYTFKDDGVIHFDENAYHFNIIVKSKDSILLDSFAYSKALTKNTIIKKLISEIRYIKTLNDPDHGSNNFTIYLSFNRNTTFQDYINFKYLFRDFKIGNTKISNDEYIY